MKVEDLDGIIAEMQKHKIEPIKCPECGRRFYVIYDELLVPLKECWQHETEEVAALGVKRYIELKGN